MNKKTGFTLPLVGGSSLLVIFAVLCLTIFALLGLSTVQADGRLADASVQAVLAYYEADCQAEDIFARLRNGEIPAGVVVKDDSYYYACPMTDNLEIQVELKKSDTRWTVMRWQAVSTLEWQPDMEIDLWNGGSFE